MPGICAKGDQGQPRRTSGFLKDPVVQGLHLRAALFRGGGGGGGGARTMPTVTWGGKHLFILLVLYYCQVGHAYSCF